MEIIVILAIVGLAGWWVYKQAESASKQSAENLAKEAEATVAKVEETVKQEVAAVDAKVKEILDVNKDGKVNLDDAKEVVK